MLGILLMASASVAWAAGPPAPIGEAIISPDGAYELTLRPQQAWAAAEVSVAGDRAVDVGPQGVGTPIGMTGDLAGAGTLWITVTAALDAQHGVTWVFAVDPEVVPLSPPELRRLARRDLPRRGGMRRLKKP